MSIKEAAVILLAMYETITMEYSSSRPPVDDDVCNAPRINLIPVSQLIQNWVGVAILVYYLMTQTWSTLEGRFVL